MNRSNNAISLFNRLMESLLIRYTIPFEMEYQINGNEIKETLKNYNYDTLELERDRKFDFYLPNHNLYIELNTLLTHNSYEQIVSQKIKEDFVQEKGSKLLIIWDTCIQKYQPKDNEIILYSKYLKGNFKNNLDKIIKSLDNLDINALNNEFLNNNPQFIDEEEYKEVIALSDKLFKNKKSKIPLQKAKELYPEWYERVVIKKQPRKIWYSNPKLYEWWLKRLKNEHIEVGHRYFCIMCLAIFAIKCNIPFDKLKEDAYNLIPLFNSETRIDESKFFLQSDVDDALKAYQPCYATFPKESMEKVSGLRINSQKRNGRSRKEHLERNQILLQVERQLHPEKFGRPSKEQIVINYRLVHPEKRKIDCIRETGLANKTVYKYWDTVEMVGDKNE